jgi:hypothetical protein
MHYKNAKVSYISICKCYFTFPSFLHIVCPSFLLSYSASFLTYFI